MQRFAGGGSRPAGMLTVRAVATATGAGAPGRFWPCPRRPGSLEVTVVVGTLYRIAESGAGFAGVASWTCWPASVSPCRSDDRCVGIRLGDTVARFTVVADGRVAGLVADLLGRRSR